MWSIPHFAANHLQRLESAGINVGEVEQRGQLELCDWEQAYFPDGRFDQDRMLAMWEELLSGRPGTGTPEHAWWLTWNGRWRTAKGCVT